MGTTKKICEYDMNGTKMIVIQTEHGTHSMPKSEWRRFQEKEKYGRRRNVDRHM